MFIPSYRDVPFNLPFPMRRHFVVLRIDPVAMVEPLRDPQATAEAKMIKPKEYLMYLINVRVADSPKSVSKTNYSCSF